MGRAQGLRHPSVNSKTNLREGRVDLDLPLVICAFFSASIPVDELLVQKINQRLPHII